MNDAAVAVNSAWWETIVYSCKNCSGILPKVRSKDGISLEESRLEFLCKYLATWCLEIHGGNDVRNRPERVLGFGG